MSEPRTLHEAIAMADERAARIVGHDEHAPPPFTTRACRLCGERIALVWLGVTKGYAFTLATGARHEDECDEYYVPLGDVVAAIKREKQEREQQECTTTT